MSAGSRTFGRCKPRLPFAARRKTQDASINATLTLNQDISPIFRMERETSPDRLPDAGASCKIMRLWAGKMGKTLFPVVPRIPSLLFPAAARHGENFPLPPDMGRKSSRPASLSSRPQGEISSQGRRNFPHARSNSYRRIDVDTESHHLTVLCSTLAPNIWGGTSCDPHGFTPRVRMTPGESRNALTPERTDAMMKQDGILSGKCEDLHSKTNQVWPQPACPVQVRYRARGAAALSVFVARVRAGCGAAHLQGMYKGRIL